MLEKRITPGGGTARVSPRRTATSLLLLQSIIITPTINHENVPGWSHRIYEREKNEIVIHLNECCN